MIDVVFVIMLFFMVMAGTVKVENELNTKLPGSAAETKARTQASAPSNTRCRCKRNKAP